MPTIIFTSTNKGILLSVSETGEKFGRFEDLRNEVIVVLDEGTGTDIALQDVESDHLYVLEVHKTENGEGGIGESHHLYSKNGDQYHGLTKLIDGTNKFGNLEIHTSRPKER